MARQTWHDVAEAFQGDQMRERAADVAGADQRDLGARHGTFLS